MRRPYFKISFLLGASLLLTNCGKKNFASDQSSESSVDSLREPSLPAEPTELTPTTRDPNQPELLAQDACVSTVQWYDGFNWIPFTTDAECIRQMKLLVTSQSQDMLNFEVRHLTKAQLKSLWSKARDTAHFVSLFKAKTAPIYAFSDGWINY